MSIKNRPSKRPVFTSEARLTRNQFRLPPKIPSSINRFVNTLYKSR
jgi:hypothetical protein